MALSLPDLAELPSGSDETPETSATVILQIASLTEARVSCSKAQDCANPLTCVPMACRPDFANLATQPRTVSPRD